MDMVVVRRLRSPEEFQMAVEVQKEAWRMDDYREAAPAHVLRGLADNGGLVLGAFYRGGMVGVSYGWPAGSYFYSHATGVSEGYKYKGVGYMLKLEQRREVLNMGIDLIKWTFDPLQSLNSRFNLNKLGVIAREYYINYYGEITDKINRGIGSDRVKAEWYITSERVLNILNKTNKNIKLEEYCIAVSSGNSYSTINVNLDCSSDVILVEIPRSIDEIRDSNVGVAIKWRSATREAYNKYINYYKYILVSNVNINNRYYNVLVNKDLDEILWG